MYRSVGASAALLNPLPKGITALDQVFASAAALPCGQGLPNEGGNCLDLNWMSAVGGCKFGQPPPAGVSAATWKKFCVYSSQCALEALPVCPSFDAAAAAAVPACMDDTFAQTVTYCDQYPGSDGPDAAKNALCWAARKTPTFMYNASVAPLCSGASRAGMSPTLKWGLVGAAVVAGAYAFSRRH